MATTFDEVFEEFNNAFRARDVPALLELYEPDARLVLPDGSVAAGTVAIGEALRTMVSLTESRLRVVPAADGSDHHHRPGGMDRL